MQTGILSLLALGIGFAAIVWGFKPWRGREKIRTEQRGQEEIELLVIGEKMAKELGEQFAVGAALHPEIHVRTQLRSSGRRSVRLEIYLPYREEHSKFASARAIANEFFRGPDRNKEYEPYLVNFRLIPNNNN